MKTTRTCYIIGCLLLAIFAVRDIAPVVSRVLTQDDWLELHESFNLSENENSQKGSERMSAEWKEYCPGHYLEYSATPLLMATNDHRIQRSVYLNQQVHLPVPTPPPDWQPAI